MQNIFETLPESELDSIQEFAQASLYSGREATSREQEKPEHGNR